MKALVFSDSHGKLNNLLAVLEKHSDYEAIFHLGDVESDEKRLRSITPYPVYMVRGNCDYYSGCQEKLAIDWYGKHIVMCHGHRYLGYGGGIRFVISVNRKRQMLSCLATRTCRFWRNWMEEYILTPEVSQNRDKKIKFPLTP